MGSETVYFKRKSSLDRSLKRRLERESRLGRRQPCRRSKGAVIIAVFCRSVGPIARSVFHGGNTGSIRNFARFRRLSPTICRAAALPIDQLNPETPSDLYHVLNGTLPFRLHDTSDRAIVRFA
jgi:hypothetical protein